MPSAVPARSFLALSSARRQPGQAVPSPCVSVCRMSALTGWCEGCWRSLDEIRAWGGSDDAAKRAIWAQVEARQRTAGLQP